MTLPPFIKSRKFWALIAGIAALIVRQYLPTFPLSDDELTRLVLLLAAFIIGTGLEDAGRAAVPPTGSAAAFAGVSRRS
jgi:hypothetical protein